MLDIHHVLFELFAVVDQCYEIIMHDQIYMLNAM